jgi:capsid portal protein
MLMERLDDIGGLRSANPNASLIPTSMEVDTRIAELRVRMRLEKMRIEALFSACCPGSSFVKLRKKLRRDLEVTGNAYLGIRRDNRGDIAEFEYLPSVSMRLRPVVAHNGSPLSVPVQVPVRRTPITVEYVTSHRVFRTFVQYGLATEVYFKQYGDPRCFSSKDGRMVDSVESLRYGEAPATEVLHLKIDSPLYEYGVPRWIGATPSVTGLRASQEVNATHFDNNAIPRMLFLVSGGVLKEGADKKLQTLLQTHAQGRENYGACVILQATPASTNPTARVTIEAKPLMKDIPNDGLFLGYGTHCRDEILSQFRLPKFAVGLLEDVNKASSGEGMQTLENQVYQPLRFDFDTDINAILEAEGILFWLFLSNSPLSRDPRTSADILEKLNRAGGVSINDSRRVAAEVHNQPYTPAPDVWGDLPLELAKLMFKPQPTPGQGGVMNGVSKSMTRVSNPTELADWIVKARDAMARGESQAWAAEAHTQHGSTLVLPMSGDEIADLVDFT